MVPDARRRDGWRGTLYYILLTHRFHARHKRCTQAHPPLVFCVNSCTDQRGIHACCNFLPNIFIHKSPDRVPMHRHRLLFAATPEGPSHRLVHLVQQRTRTRQDTLLKLFIALHWKLYAPPWNPKTKRTWTCSHQKRRHWR